MYNEVRRDDDHLEDQEYERQSRPLLRFGCLVSTSVLLAWKLQI